MIRVNQRISIHEGELHYDFVRAGGPGGQNVNKVSTAAQLRFDVRNSPSLPEDVRARLTSLAGRRITTDGILIIEARASRSQEKNREDALQRLVELIGRACERPRTRHRTRPTAGSRERRLLGKRQHGEKKKIRRERPRIED